MMGETFPDLLDDVDVFEIAGRPANPADPGRRPSHGTRWQRRCLDHQQRMFEDQHAGGKHSRRLSRHAQHFLRFRRRSRQLFFIYFFVLSFLIRPALIQFAPPFKIGHPGFRRLRGQRQCARPSLLRSRMRRWIGAGRHYNHRSSVRTAFQGIPEADAASSHR